MDLATALAGLDAHPWDAVSHAYGSAEDLPDLLRALAGGGEEAQDAVSELFSCILHQGSVYSASADAAPYLARIAAAGRKPLEALWLLGGMAESVDERGVEPGVVRAAVAAQLPLLIPLLADADAAVRQAAVWTVGHTGAEGALPALRRRWTEESEPAVRAVLLTALGRFDAEAAAAEARRLLGEGTPAPLRLTALFTALDAGEPWSGDHHAAALALLPADELAGELYEEDRREPLQAITDALLRRDTEADREAALALIDAALRDERPEVRAEALWAADHACRLSRGAPLRLIPAIAPLAADSAAASLLGKLGPAAAEAAPLLARLAARAEDEEADQALSALVLVAPEQAVPLLARALGRRPRALDSAAGLRAPADTVLPFDPELFAAVRARLAADGLGNNETAQLVTLLRRWGPRAVAALPELCAVLPGWPYAGSAIAAVTADGSPQERERAAAALRAAGGSVMVARAHHEFTGETDVLSAAVTAGLAPGSYGMAEAARAAADLGPAAAELLPVLRAALSGDGRTTPQLEADSAIAVALWRIGGDGEEAVRILASALDRAARLQWGRWTLVHVVDAVALLGEAARHLAPLLEPLLDDPETAAATVRALLAVADPAALDRPRLAEAALRSAETESDTEGALEALRALGAAALTPDQRLRLTVLAEGDRRVVGSGLEDEILRRDERFRAAAAELAQGTRRPTRGSEDGTTGGTDHGSGRDFGRN